MKRIYAPLIISIFSFYFSSAQVHELWGTTSSGGAVNAGGTIFKVNIDGSGFGLVHSFDTLAEYGPQGSLIQAPNGLLFGTTEYGGLGSSGTIFDYDPSGNTYTKDFDFDYYTNGGYPQSSLLLANDNFVYGMTSGGGINGDGTIFRINPDSKAVEHFFDFSDSVGRYPFGYLIQATNGTLYGLTSDGGGDSTTIGTLFSYDISSNAFSVLHNFTPATGIAPDRGLLQTSNGMLYGMTSGGGRYGFGAIFSFNLSGNIYTDVFDFNDTTGANPYGSLIQTSDGLLYGMTSNGGANVFYGTIFRFDPLNNNSYTDLFDFNGANGSSPEGELLQASNGLLYGMTQLGGGNANDAGLIFNFDQTSSAYTDMHDFDITDGQYPWADLIELTFTGITEKTGVENIQLYPNPADKELIIKSAGLKMEMIDMYNVLGEKIYSQQMTAMAATTVDISGLSQGVYFINVYHGQSKWIGKFVKE